MLFSVNANAQEKKNFFILGSGATSHDTNIENYKKSYGDGAPDAEVRTGDSYLFLGWGRKIGDTSRFELGYATLGSAKFMRNPDATPLPNYTSIVTIDIAYVHGISINDMTQQ